MIYQKSLPITKMEITISLHFPIRLHFYYIIELSYLLIDAKQNPLTFLKSPTAFHTNNSIFQGRRSPARLG